MRIVSYNVRYFAHGLKGLASTAGMKRRISDALHALRPLPDIVCLQEIETRSIRSGVAHRGGNGDNQLNAFLRHLDAAFTREGETLPYDPYYFPAHTYRVGAVRLYTTGLAVLVHRDSLEVLDGNQKAPHSITHYGSEWLKPAKQTRICAHLHVRDRAGKRFHVFNTHLSLPSVFAREFWREERRMGHGRNQISEAEALARYVDERAQGEPFILGGDFNSGPASPVYRFLTEKARLVGAQEALAHLDPKNPEHFCTAGFLNLRMHLDHLFGVRVRWVDLEETAPFGDPKSRFYGLSDHAPLIARFELE